MGVCLSVGVPVMTVLSAKHHSSVSLSVVPGVYACSCHCFRGL